ncbi:MAG: C-terminal binding protein [Oscillospiraceae bacterium]|nr:C-terminal binding protein [Oscillospiraceae bacterium]
MRIMYTDTDHPSLDIERGVIEGAGLSFTVTQCKTEDDVIANCKDADILINQYAPITARVMDNLPNFKMVVRYGVGVDNVEVAEAVKRGIVVCNVPDYGTNEVADQALALMMALVRKVVTVNEYTKNVDWDCTKAFPIQRLSTLTVGILGFGRIGQAFAKRVHALGCNIISCDHHLEPGQLAPCGYVTGCTLDELIEQSDIISIHCPPIKGQYMIDADAFKRMKKGIYIINDARGGIIDEDALDEALDNGTVAGVALDCMRGEPVKPGNKLFRHPNMIVSPHMGWYSVQAAEDLKRKVAEQAVKFAQTGTVDYPVYKN